MHGLLDVLEALTTAGRAADAVALGEHVMARLDTAVGRIDDSGGYMGGVLDRVADIHLAACLVARPEPRRLAVRLVELALKSDLEWFLDAPRRYADVLGEEGLAAYRARLEREWETLPPLPPSERPVFARVDRRRFTVTRLRESLARAGGNLDELVSVLANDLSSPLSFCRIADELEQAGREREALAWLERGLGAFPPAADARLRSRLTRAYFRDGQIEEHADVRAYREAVALLREIRDTLAAGAREEEFADDVERIREAHRRRPKLLSLLAAEGW